MACASVSVLTGGSTPYASHVRNIMFVGESPMAGILAL